MGDPIRPYPNIGMCDSYLTGCAMGGNLLAASLSGDMRKLMKTIYGVDGTDVNVLDGLSDLHITKLGYFIWMFSTLFNGYNGRITPDLVLAVAAIPLVIDMAANQQSPAIATEIETKVPLNTTTPNSFTVTDLFADNTGAGYTNTFQGTPCKYVSRILKYFFSVVQTAVGGVNTCKTFPKVDLSGIPVTQNTGAYIPGGQIPVSTRTVTALQNTTVTIRWHGETSEQVADILTGYNDILEDSLVPTIAGKIKDRISNLFDVREARATEIAKGNAANLSYEVPSLQDINGSPLVRQSLEYRRPMVTVDRNITPMSAGSIYTTQNGHRVAV